MQQLKPSSLVSDPDCSRLHHLAAVGTTRCSSRRRSPDPARGEQHGHPWKSRSIGPWSYGCGGSRSRQRHGRSWFGDVANGLLVADTSNRDEI
ncbi:hypothetical protein PAHAL_5G307800 [Panicum hallii]|uniref:Uncharacterized protein n=1 Tax=Panicum hallii TaxID=206008 RepID=A0A2T8ILS9_9POAL|nr:hypothetical protein PAHAL_5G307800 [Panicum hallii]